MCYWCQIMIQGKKRTFTEDSVHFFKRHAFSLRVHYAGVISRCEVAKEALVDERK